MNNTNINIYKKLIKVFIILFFISFILFIIKLTVFILSKNFVIILDTILTFSIMITNIIGIIWTYNKNFLHKKTKNKKVLLLSIFIEWIFITIYLCLIIISIIKIVNLNNKIVSPNNNNNNLLFIIYLTSSIFLGSIELILLINIYWFSKIRFTIIYVNFKLCIIELHIALAIGIVLIILNNLSNDDYIRELVSKILTICFGIILIPIDVYNSIKNIKLYKKNK